MTPDLKKKRAGRPSREPKPGERVNLSLRVTPEVKVGLEREAAAAGRSLSQEAEMRLEQSFRDQALLPQVLELAYGPQLSAMIMMAALAMKSAGALAAFRATNSLDEMERWFLDPWAFNQAVRAGMFLLMVLGPEGEIKEPTRITLEGSPDVQKLLDASAAPASAAASKVLRDVLLPSENLELSPALAQAIARMLGPIAETARKKIEAQDIEGNGAKK